MGGMLQRIKREVAKTATGERTPEFLVRIDYRLTPTGDLYSMYVERKIPVPSRTKVVG